jgi:hypothetical protein
LGGESVTHFFYITERGFAGCGILPGIEAEQRLMIWPRDNPNMARGTPDERRREPTDLPRLTRCLGTH